MTGKTILFSANDGSHGYELWVTDGTSGGTSLLFDINPGGGNSYPHDITSLGNGSAVFSANDGSHGYELWVTDGTHAGTSLVMDIYPGVVGSDPHYMTAISPGEVLFNANDGMDGSELWVTDGTTAGTHIVKDINPGASGSNPQEITALGGGKAVFTANDGTHGTELWTSNGTSAGTYLVQDIDPGLTSSYITDITPIGNGRALFQANDGANGAELWVTDGTSAGTSMVKNIDGASTSSYPTDITSLGNGHAVFEANDGVDGAELWVTDGTSAGTLLVMDINPGAASSYPHDITSLGNGNALFAANDGTNGYELWVTNGTSGGTYMLADINPGANGSKPSDITVVGNGEALFEASDGTHGYELWTTNGTAAGTSLVRDINAGAANSHPTDLTVLASIACFASGTRIRAVEGEVAVEDLREGDLVMTQSGDARAVRWIGRRRIQLERHPQPQRVTPIRIHAGAFGDGQPMRDLLVSPDHAMLLDGMLIPANLLVNGASIVATTEFESVVYYHVELESHDILMAEGVPAESYLDTGNRGMFENGSTPLALHPDFAAAQQQREALSCAPFVDRPGGVEPIWRQLAARAEALGWPLPTAQELTEEPGLRILIGTQCVKPIVSVNGRYMFVLPPSREIARLVSGAAQPSEVRPWVNDHRLLGVKVRRLTWRSVTGVRDIAMDAAILEQGWWAVEWDGNCPTRWTDGEATLPRLDAGLLEIELSGSMRHPVRRATERGQRAAA